MYKKIVFFCICFLYIGNVFVYAINIKEYFPIQAGYGWIYLSKSIEDGIENQDYIVKIMQKISENRTRYLEKGQIDFPNNTEGPCFRDIKWDQDGLKVYRNFDIEDNINETSPRGELFLPLNLELGEQKTTILGSVLLEKTGVQINVPAGTFSDCIKLKIGYEDGGYEEWWMAKNIGIVKEVTHESDEVEIEELVAARIDNKIIGEPPLCSNIPISFVFSNIIPKETSLIFDGVYIEGYENTFWAKFDFDINNLSFQLDPQHYGTGSMDENLNGEKISGLNFEGIVPYVWTCTTGCAVSGGVAIFLQATYNRENYYIELSFNLQSCEFQILHLWNNEGDMLF